MQLSACPYSGLERIGIGSYKSEVLQETNAHLFKDSGKDKEKKTPWKTMHISMASLTLASIVEPSNVFQSQIFHSLTDSSAGLTEDTLQVPSVRRQQPGKAQLRQ